MKDVCSHETCDLSQPGWWAVYTKHQHEQRVAEMASLKGAEVFLPLYDARRERKYRTVTLPVPLFPSYVFVREQPAMRIPVLSIPGVHMIVTRGSEYGVIPDHEIQNLRLAMTSQRGIEPYGHIAVGERVRIIRGALEGLEGVLVRQKNLCRVVVSVQMLAQSAAIEVDLSEIVAVREVRASALQPGAPASEVAAAGCAQTIPGRPYGGPHQAGGTPFVQHGPVAG